MYHYGSKQLAVGGTYILEREQTNQWDANAVTVKDGNRTVGYLKQEFVAVVSKVCQAKTSAIYQGQRKPIFLPVQTDF